jgi:hypothetical protein
MHAALSEDLAQHKKARWLTPAIFAILRVTQIYTIYTGQNVESINLAIYRIYTIYTGQNVEYINLAIYRIYTIEVCGKISQQL